MQSTGALLCLTLLCLCPAGGAGAAGPAPLSLNEGLGPGEGPFDPAVPAPASVLGFEVGSRPARHDEVLRYYEALAASTPRARLARYAGSHEGRSLVYLTISSAENMERLEEIDAANRRLGDPRTHAPREVERMVEGQPLIAWIGYSIHGDEISGSDASLLVAYRLAAGMDAGTVRLRDSLVTHLDPCENPDGRERFLAQITAFSKVVPNPDTEGIAHKAMWPWGRGNHYLFDLNRDWFTLVHPESRGRTPAIARVQPQLMVDAHEMGSHDTYLFSPPRHPFNPYLPPAIRKWWDVFAADQGAAFDERGWPYYTREWHEEFFPGYGSAWAMYLGAVGILYEQAGTEGGPVRQRGGALLTYTDAVEHQVVSSIANLETAADNRREILADWAADRRDAVEAGRRGPVRAYVLPHGRDPFRTARLVEKLLAQGIEVQVNRSRVKARDLHDAWSGRAVTAEIPPGSFLVRLDQPAAPLVRNLLDFHLPMGPEFLREEREHLEREKGSRLYETTAWSMLLSYGVEAWWTGSVPRGDWVPVGNLGSPHAWPSPGASGIGYLFDSSTDDGIALAAGLLEAGVRLRAGRKPFTFQGREYPRGTILIRTEENTDDLHGRLEAALAGRQGVVVHPLAGARILDGPDLGGRQFQPLVRPKIGVLTGDPISFTSYGAVWHLLDRRLEVRFSGLDIGRFHQTDISRYNVLVFPGCWAGPDGYRRRLGEKGIEKLKRWIEAGGTAVGLGTGAEFLAMEETGISRVRPRRQALEAYPPVILGPDAEAVEAAGRFRATGLRATPEGGKGKRSAPAGGASSYGVPPVVGPGARGYLPRGQAAYVFPQQLVTLDKWAEPVLPAGDGEAGKAFLERADARLRRFRPKGAYLRVDLDPSHWLAYGCPEKVPAHFGGKDVLVAESSVEVAGRFAGLEDLHVGGLLWPEAAGRIAHSAWVTREQVGKGQVVLFASDPVYRGASWATQRLFLNAVLLGPGIGAKWPNPW